MDRMDLVVRVDRIDPDLLIAARPGESSSKVRTRVLTTRDFAAGRGGLAASLGGAELLSACRMRKRTSAEFTRTARSQHFSGRAVTRTLRVARTIADLDGAIAVDSSHLAEAVGYRGLEAQWAG